MLSKSLKFMLSSAFSLPPTILAFVGRTGFGGAVSGGGFIFLRIGESRGCKGTPKIFIIKNHDKLKEI